MDGSGGAGGNRYGGHGLAGHGVGHGPVEIRRGAGHHRIFAGFVARLGEQIGAQGVGLSPVCQIVQLEGVGPAAGARGQVAKLRLDLAVFAGDRGIRAHKDHRGGMDRPVYVGKARADLNGGVVGAGLGADVHRHGCGHQKALGDLTGGMTGEGNVILTQILAEGRGQTRNVRGGHGGAGHDLILIGAAHGGVGGVQMRAVQRIDLAAGGGDLGLHDQRAGHAPGGKIAHLGVVGGEGADHFCGHGHRAGIIGDGAGAVGGGGGLDRVCVVQRDGDHREGAGVGAQRHVDGSRRVVGDDQGLGIVGDQIVALFKEGDVASVAEDDLPGQTDSGVNGGVILCAARGVHVNVFVAACDCGQLRAAGVGLVIENRLAVVEGHRGAGQTGVVGGGHAQTVDVGAGAAAGVHVDVLDIELLLIVRQHIGEVVGVARGDGNHRFGVYHGVGELVQGGLVGGGVGEALDRAAEGEVHRVAAENDGVLDGDHVVGIVSAAACAEDLHNEELRVGSHADGVNGFRCVRVGVAVLDEAVGCRNTRHVRAVLALGVAQVVDLGI